MSGCHLPPQRLVSIPDLLSAIKLLCMRFQRELVTVVDDLRLDTLLRMLKTPHFSTKMNSLKEVTNINYTRCHVLDIEGLVHDGKCCC